jgi:1-acyl-sn-glycerol-3-phosphate acyltransferase
MDLSAIILRLFGWTLIGDYTHIKKSVVVMAPHTSNWDFVIGKLYLSAMGMNNHTLMKKEAFFFPMNHLLTFLGAIPVDRKNKAVSLVQQASRLIKKNKEFNIFIAPEGTRKLNKRWKKGFFYIAQEANVPIALSYVDYKKKEVGIAKIINETNKIEDVMKEINEFYKKITPKHSESFVLDKRY